MVSRTRSVIVAGRFVESERDRPFEARRPGNENPDAALGRVRGNPASVRLRAGGGRLDALPAGGGDSLCRFTGPLAQSAR